MIGFIIGVFVGGILGVVIMALMAAAKGGNEEMILFMTDQQVKHDGKMWDIEEMTEKGGQTIVHLKHGDDRLEFSKRLLKMRIKATGLLRQLNTARDPEQALRIACRYIETIRNEDSGLEKCVLTNTGKEK